MPSVPPLSSFELMDSHISSVNLVLLICKMGAITVHSSRCEQIKGSNGCKVQSIRLAHSRC